MTSTTTLPFRDTGYFSKLICDYIDECDELTPFYNNFPDLDGFEKQIKEKQIEFPISTRQVLFDQLTKQYADFDTSKETNCNIESLLERNTFTITTGHQLNLFTGPLYFLYKIISTINLTKQLKKEFPDFNFVPIYWMATEDHDFEEIQFFNFKGNKITWNKDASGGVGRLLTDDIEVVFDQFSKLLGKSTNAKELKVLFEKSYLQHNNLADATRFLANELFKDYGLVIIDGDSQELKREFIPFVKDELLHQTSFKEVSKTISKLEEISKIQVNPREVNLFYLKENLRERIIYEEGKYLINNTNISFSKKEIIDEVNNFPERFSPNVLMRPLYQEVILPNLCYIGGGGELAYWFELKNYFKKVNISFPILLLRNSALLITERQNKKLENLNISVSEIFLKQQHLIEKKIKDVSDIKIDLSQQKQDLQNMFKDLEILSNKTDKSFLGAVKAQEKKQLNGIDKLEKRLLKAQKRRLFDLVNRIKGLQNEMFPKCSLQERNTNFADFYEMYGSQLIEILVEQLNPLNKEFYIIELK